jgi:hypothetical protein
MVSAMVLLITWFVLALWFLRGIWRSLTEPPSMNSWRFDGNSYESIGERAQFLKRKIRFAKSNGIRESKKAKWQAELDKLSEKYDVEESIQSIIQDTKFKNQVYKLQKEIENFGYHAPKVKCPHCGEKGNVWKNESAKTTEESREKGIIGATIGRKTITEKTVTKLHCKNCKTSWVI